MSALRPSSNALEKVSRENRVRRPAAAHAPQRARERGPEYADVERHDYHQPHGIFWLITGDDDRLRLFRSRRAAAPAGWHRQNRLYSHSCASVYALMSRSSTVIRTIGHQQATMT